MSSEKRIFNCDKLEIRSDGDKRTLYGHGAVFNKNSEDLGGFTEIIAPGAFDDVLGDDVRALFNHDPNLILGRTKSGTLRLSVDETGLAYEVDLPDTQAARDLQISMDRKDVTQSSFAFQVKSDEWTEADDTYLRTITKFERLYDVSPVTYPAYPDADSGVRSLKEHQEKELFEQKEREEKIKSDLALRKAKLRLKDMA